MEPLDIDQDTDIDTADIVCSGGIMLPAPNPQDLTNG